MDFKTVIDYLDEFVIARRKMLEEMGVEVSYRRAVCDVSNQFSELRLRHGDKRTSVVMWESGKAVVSVDKPGDRYEKRFDDMYNDEEQFGLVFRELLLNLELPG